MSRQIAMFMHVLLIFVQLANAADKLVPFLGLPSDVHVYVAIVAAGAQAALGWFQHQFNPDGTPATVAFIPK